MMNAAFSARCRRRSPAPLAAKWPASISVTSSSMRPSSPSDAVGDVVPCDGESPAAAPAVRRATAPRVLAAGLSALPAAAAGEAVPLGAVGAPWPAVSPGPGDARLRGWRRRYLSFATNFNGSLAVV